MSLLNMVGVKSNQISHNYHWVNMPEFVQEELYPHAQVEVYFETEEDLQKFADLVEQKLTNKTKSSWFPFKSHYGKVKRVWESTEKHNPQFPIYIISKGRWESRLTSKALDEIGVPYKIIVEESEYQNYVNEVGADKVLILPQKYIDNYDTCSTDLTLSKGSGCARNFAWEHSIEQGYEYHWLLDDNLKSFQRLHENFKGKVTDGTIFKCAEDFVTRYENIGISGFNYETFCYAKEWCPPYNFNTKVYSCLLIKNDIPFRWRGRYNEDVELCLRVMKAGFVTCQFNAFLCEKITTQRMNGGNTDELYKNGTMEKSKMLEVLHPDVARVTWKFNRWHHHVNYKPFEKNLPKFKQGLELGEGVNNYGMVLKEKTDE